MKKKRKDNVDLICSVAELSGLFSNSRDLEGFLQEVVNMVAAHMHAAVCSVYLYDEEADELVLRATMGLNPESIGTTRLKLGEGITGMALKELRPICEAEGSRNPYFKFIPGSNEEKYSAFLAVPIVRGLTRIGVLVVQEVKHGYFDANDTKALRAITSQLAGTIENARMLMSLHPAAKDIGPKQLQVPDFFKGQAGTGGIARGVAESYGKKHFSAAGTDRDDPRVAALTMEDFDRALVRTEQELEALEEHMRQVMVDLSASLIFGTQLLMLKDESFSGEIRRRIEKGSGVLGSVRDVVEEFVQLFQASPNARVKEKTQDIQDVGLRLFRHLVPGSESDTQYEGRIVIAGDILPSTMLKIAAQKTVGMILTEGSFTAHLAILSRSLRIPTVIVKDERILSVPDGTELLLDANQWTIYVNPGSDIIQGYEELAAAGGDVERLTGSGKPERYTRDGKRVRLLANINLLSELDLARQVCAEGIGLYRSEFPYLVRDDFPTEEEQYRIYRKLVKAMEGRPVTFRTLDVGGDKMLSYFPAVNEDNPFLGLRAIRFSLRHQDVFVQQLRALLRAGVGAEIGIMFPLVASVDDFIQAGELIASCKRELQSEGAQFAEHVKLGAMVELPSAVSMVDELARRADFLCLGTNDLIQYLLGVDRTNMDVAEHYVSYHPAVLRALKQVAGSAYAAGKEVSICGEMAGDPLMIPFLIGIGIRTFSLDAQHIIPVEKCIAGVEAGEAEAFADRLLACSTIREIEELVNPEGK